MSDDLRPSTICGLLYCGKGGERHTNMAGGDGDPLLIYAQNAATLARSLAAHGQAFTLVTNDAARVGALVEQAGAHGLVTVTPVDFTLDVPDGIPFYSAHFKLELLRLFGEGRFGAFPALLDLDVVALKPLAFPHRPGLWTYDIAHEMLDSDGGAVASLDALAGAPLRSRTWFGGEFLAGPQAGFAKLWNMVEQLWPDYCESAGKWYHSGDEMVISAALNRLIDDGHAVNDAGAAGLVARWWSVRTKRRLGRLADAQQCAILHLPADKHLLARHSNKSFDPSAFVADLRADVRGRGSILRTIAHNLKGRRFAPLLD